MHFCVQCVFALPMLIHTRPQGMRLAVRKELKGGSDWIKILATGAFMASSARDSPELTHFSQAELAACVEEARGRGVPVMAHAHGARGIAMCARAGVRSIEHGSFVDEEGIAACVQNGVFLVPTLHVSEHDFSDCAFQERSMQLMRATRERHLACMRAAVRGGVRIVLGSDFCGWPPHRSAREFAHLVGIGMTAHESIRAGTLVAAEMLELEGEIGSVEEGKWADLVVVSGNPLEDVVLLETNVVAVFRSGEAVRHPWESKM